VILPQVHHTAQHDGNPIEQYGDLDLEMSRKKLDQTGAIQQLLG